MSSYVPYGFASVTPDAYFTTQPPPEPQRLVLVGGLPDPSKVSDKMKQFLKNILKIEHPEEATSEFKKKETSLIKTGNLQLDEASKSMKSIKLMKQKQHKKGSREVRQLLHHLVSNLPVSESTISNCDSPSTVSETRMRQRALVPPQRSSCNIAVQAHSEMFTNSRQASAESGGVEEWMGGVRALRDSHVRLVQRQLRHIERLNRALDRVSRPGQKSTHRAIHI